MAHKILSVKLCELDERLGQMHSRIQMSELLSPAQIRTEVDALRRECRENELTLRSRLKFSKAGMVAELADSYGEVEQIIQRVKEKIKTSAGEEALAENKILLAEYALDFAMQAANHALLVSMEALEAQMDRQEKEESAKS